MLFAAGVFNSCRHKTPPPVPLKPEFSAITYPVIKPGDDETLILLHTSLGDMKLRLFNQTPKHRDNFVKLVESKFFDSLLFHRVIKDFVIQGGDPDSKNAVKGKLLGDGGPGYTIPAEFFTSKLFHRKGVLAAAREGDDVNPNKESSGSQFYIVQGKIQDEESLEKNERRINRGVIQLISDSLLSLPENGKLKSDFTRIKANGGDSLAILQKKIDGIVNSVYAVHAKYKIPEEQRKIYKTLGGTPHLDTHYTVFGEVYEGWDVLDKIAALPGDENNRPLTDVKMSMKILRKGK
jgi:peptidylprolyl isomerase